MPRFNLDMAGSDPFLSPRAALDEIQNLRAKDPNSADKPLFAKSNGFADVKNTTSSPPSTSGHGMPPSFNPTTPNFAHTTKSASATPQEFYTPQSTTLTSEEVSFEAQRKAWICNTAAQIAHRHRAVLWAQRKFQLTGSLTDFDLWQQAMRDFNDLVDLDRLQEERRNLWLKKKGMTALRTGEGNLEEDGHKGVLRRDGRGVLLGGRMALMERWCGVLRSAEERKAKREKEAGMDNENDGGEKK